MGVCIGFFEGPVAEYTAHHRNPCGPISVSDYTALGLWPAERGELVMDLA